MSVREARVACECWWMKEALELLANRVRSRGNEAKTEVVSLARAANVALVANA